MKATLTEMLLHPDEFDHVQVTQDSHVTFCLKELRVMAFISGAFSCHMRPVCVCVGVYLQWRFMPGGHVFYA